MIFGEIITSDYRYYGDSLWREKKNSIEENMADGQYGLGSGVPVRKKEELSWEEVMFNKGED